MSDCWPRHIDCAHREYIGKACTLYGHPAKIAMEVDGHPVVAPLDTRLGVEPYSWMSVFQIMDDREGRFGE